MNRYQAARLERLCYARGLRAAARGDNQCVTYWTTYHRWIQRYKTRRGRTVN